MKTFLGAVGFLMVFIASHVAADRLPLLVPIDATNERIDVMTEAEEKELILKRQRERFARREQAATERQGEFDPAAETVKVDVAKQPAKAMRPQSWFQRGCDE